MWTCDKYAITSNEVKLLHHLDALQALQRGQARPILLCVAPTNRCQLACPHCCFRDRDRGLELDFRVLEETTRELHWRGLKSVELTGGGEPTLYPRIEKYLNLCARLALPVGCNTNGRTQGVPWHRFAWVRLNANVWREADVIDVVAGGQPTTACYVVSPHDEAGRLETAIRQAVAWGIPLRIALDCQQPPDQLARFVARLAERVGQVPGVFVSDFNTPTGPRAHSRCWMPYVKPLLWPDGWLYACPSAELALENGSDVGERFRLCRGEEAGAFYARPPAAREHDCSFCKYAAQNTLLDAAMQEVAFAAFV